jgi:hypothetical protein
VTRKEGRMSEEYIPGVGCTCSAWNESECGCDGVDWTPKEVYELREKCSNLDDQLSSAMMVIRGLEGEIENLKASGIHTCHDKCKRPMCVMVRERDKARQQRDRITTIARELIAMIRINVMVGRFAECTVEQIDEHLKPWIDKIAAVKGGSDE